jgi:hypothetical protein
MAGSCSASKTRPTITSHRARSLSRNRDREILDSLRTSFCAADGGARPNSGGTPFRQPCPAYPSTKGRKAPQERFSEESFRTSYFKSATSSGNVFLFVYSSTASLLCTPPHSKTHSTQQAWMYSRNQTTIAICCKHRQPVFLHPSIAETGTQSETAVFVEWVRLSCKRLRELSRVHWREDASHRTLRISAGGSRAQRARAHASWAPRLADSVSSLYTTSFPIHSTAGLVPFRSARPGQRFGTTLKENAQRGVHGSVAFERLAVDGRNPLSLEHQWMW